MSSNLGRTYSLTARLLSPALPRLYQTMAEEANIKSLSEEHPAVKAAYENFRRAEEQLKATIILSKDEEPTS